MFRERIIRDVDQTFHPKREARRFLARLSAHAIQEGYEIPCFVSNISSTGARLIFDPVAKSAFSAETLIVHIHQIGQFPADLRWTKATSAGVQFAISDSVKQFLARRLNAEFEKLPNRSLRKAG
ncbi:MAG: PilZ domain-containing protein [Pelagimonas sp.]|uniref:PilZ domain-containing protein n=1 Tax=Pelagimonas sp. TaxID=2073170 RepID=UPI003D6AEA62